MGWKARAGALFAVGLAMMLMMLMASGASAQLGVGTIGTDANFKEVVIEASKTKPVVAFYWWRRCQPCIALRPLLFEIVQRDKLNLVLLDIEDAPLSVGNTNGVALPLVIIYRDGKPVDQISGPQVLGILENFLAPLKQ